MSLLNYPSVIGGNKMASFQGIIDKIYIKKFRKFVDVEMHCGKKLTVIAGQNGTQKTTLLGLLAQPFSMSKRNPENSNPNTVGDSGSESFYEFKTLTGHAFQSKFADKFKLDEKKEHPGDHEYSLYMVDSSLGDNGVFTLESIRRDKKGNKLRIWKKRARSAGDGYLHYPVIYLSLKRVSPIGEETRIKNDKAQLTTEEATFLQQNYDEILALLPEEYETNKLDSSNKKTLIAHPSAYSALTVSAGQDNIGSILTAILSFKRLQENFPNEYKGGLLFIDEIESTLFPASQSKLIEKLFKYARDYKLQIFCTTHSPSVINIAKQDKYKYDCCFNYLKCVNKDKIIVETDITPEQIYAHLSLQPIVRTKEKVKKIRVYTEDDEARLFLRDLLHNKYRKLLNIVKINIGAEELIDLKNRKIEEFTKNMIILDGDQPENSSKNILTLPGGSGPDKMLYEFLHNLPPDDPFWPDNSCTGGYSWQVCFKDYHTLPNPNNGALRLFYKDWFKQQSQYWNANKLSAFRYWIQNNKDAVDAFIHEFEKCYNYLARKNNLPTLP